MTVRQEHWFFGFGLILRTNDDLTRNLTQTGSGGKTSARRGDHSGHPFLSGERIKNLVRSYLDARRDTLTPPLLITNEGHSEKIVSART